MTSDTKQSVNLEFKNHKCPNCKCIIVKGAIVKLRIQCPDCRKLVTIQLK